MTRTVFAVFAAAVAIAACGSRPTDTASDPEPQPQQPADTSHPVTPAVPRTDVGLDFPGSVGTHGTLRFTFTSPPSYPATIIMQVNPRAQLGYYTTFFYGNDGPFEGTKDFYGFHPYPDWGNQDPTAHLWEIAAPPGLDVTGPAVVFGRWYQQAAVVYKDQGRTYHTFYYDLTDPTKVILHVGDGNLEPPTSPVLTFGDAPWNGGQEVMHGVIRGIQIYDAALSPYEIMLEIAAPGSSGKGSHLWYLNRDPNPSDISDKSGKGHNPAWVGAERPTLWCSNANAPACR